MEPRENMKCSIPELVTTKCNEFISNFNNSNTSWVMRNTSHDKMWKENESTIIKITERILGTLLSNFLINDISIFSRVPNILLFDHICVFYVSVMRYKIIQHL